MPSQNLLLVAKPLVGCSSTPWEPRLRETRSCGSLPLWFIWLLWSVWFIWLNETNQMNQKNKTNQIDHMASSCGKIELMPQDMVARSLFDIDLSSAPPAMPDRHLVRIPQTYLLLKMPYRFNTSYQLPAHSSADVLCDWFHSMNFRRSRP